MSGDSYLMDMDEKEGSALWFDIAKACPFSIVIVDTSSRVWLVSDKSTGVVEYDRRLDKREWSGCSVIDPDISGRLGMKNAIIQLVEVDEEHGDPSLERFEL